MSGKCLQGLTMSDKVFISYRRDDSSGYAGRLHDQLARGLGQDLLFMDVTAIPLGANFPKYIAEEVDKCGVLLALIGPGWLDARDEEGRRRLDSPHDFVRIEIAAALKRNIRVIPILLMGTPLPKAEQLPDELKELPLLNALDVRHASFDIDVDKLIRALKGTSTPSPALSGPPTPKLKCAFDPADPGCVRPPATVTWLSSEGHVVGSFEASYFRIRVECVSGAQADGCRGRLVSIHRDGVAVLKGENLHLTFAPAEQVDTHSKRIDSDVPEYLDLVAISSRSDRVLIATQNFRYPSSIKPDQIFQRPGDYVFRVVVSFAQGPSSTIETVLRWTGDLATSRMEPTVPSA
jgi:hypothetical protein